jgi:hypothetical protein
VSRFKLGALWFVVAGVASAASLIPERPATAHDRGPALAPLEAERPGRDGPAIQIVQLITFNRDQRGGEAAAAAVNLNGPASDGGPSASVGADGISASAGGASASVGADGISASTGGASASVGADGISASVGGISASVGSDGISVDGVGIGGDGNL